METKGEYRGIIYESEPELWFLFWAFELHNKGIIKTIRRAPSFNLTEGLDNEFVIKDMKGREVTKKQTILRPSLYTPEFEIFWGIHTYKKFVWLDGDGKITVPFVGMYDPEGVKTLVEVKPDFDQNNMTRLFKNNQKFLWDKHKIFVNLVKIKELFEKTFCPAEWLHTRTGKDRKVNFTIKLLNQYLDGRE
jgi:hypothetical protein